MDEARLTFNLQELQKQSGGKKGSQCLTEFLNRPKANVVARMTQLEQKLIELDQREGLSVIGESEVQNKL